MILYASPDVQRKILYKHHIAWDELKDALRNGKPKFIRREGNTYLAITHHERYITIIFNYHPPFALVMTVYISSDEQTKRYNKK